MLILKISDPALDFELMSDTGRTVKLSDFRGGQGHVSSAETFLAETVAR